MNNRLCVFAHFNKECIIADYVFYYIEQLNKIASNIVFVSSSKILPEYKQKLSQYCFQIIEKDNVGYDYGSWQKGIQTIGFDEIKKYDELIIANDSCFAPIFPFNEMFSAMEQKKCDFWGVTDFIIWHKYIESYFVVFRKNVLQSNSFCDFWNKDMSHLHTKHEFVSQLEQSLTRCFVKSGYKFKVYITYNYFQRFGFGLYHNYKVLSALVNGKSRKFYEGKFQPVDSEQKLSPIKRFSILLSKALRMIAPFHYNCHLLIPVQLLKKRVPFMKTMLVKNNPMNTSLDRVIQTVEQKSDYDINLIKAMLPKNEKE